MFTKNCGVSVKHIYLSRIVSSEADAVEKNTGGVDPIKTNFDKLERCLN
jgi:hypothetical protein